ncbi:MAG: hypothetical protein LBU47_02390 [Christensenellaceae bacterium]|jgi:hypothetical protein|nr:hypothetical protein [Christensenellaceae bacterium]
MRILLWPFKALFSLLGGILSLTGRLVGIILSLVLMVVGLVLTVTLVAAVVGIPLFFIGLFLLIRSFF